MSKGWENKHLQISEIEVFSMQIHDIIFNFQCMYSI